MKKTILIFSLLLGLSASSALAQGRDSVSAGDDMVYITVEVMPEYPGGHSAMSAYLAGAIKYPEAAMKKRISGTVYVSFVVSADGSITDVKVLRGISPECDAEALRVVKEMPDWKPGRQHGKPVNVQFNLPIKFRMDKPQPKDSLKGGSSER
jgi:periplasmic protein TonB